MRFYILDVFAEEKYAGNQLAVFRNCSHLKQEEMQRIALEMNYSETTFIMSEEPENDGYDVRIFTPGSELPFAGHPTLGTAYVIAKEVIGAEVERVNLNLKVGQIPVTFENDILWMKQVQPEFGQRLTVKQVAKMLSLEERDFDDRFPIEEVSTGVYFLAVPLKSMDAVKRASVQIDHLRQLVQSLHCREVLVFSPETYGSENNLNARMFAPYLGIVEDAATGSANGCLAAYLVEHKYFGSDKIDIRVEQGYEIKRPSLLYLRAGKSGNKIDVNVGGKVVMVARGEFV